ncbi:MAG: DNA polymerase III subunit chi [Alphaproteobacteria bacterium]
MEVRFYHLTRTALEQALPEVLEKVIARGWRAVVLTGSPERAEALSHALWTHGRDSFLPHGTARDGAAAAQPVWITPEDENPNQASVLIVTDGADSRLDGYALRCEFFDDRDEAAVAVARQRWRDCTAAGRTVQYYRQSASGWESVSDDR